MKRHHSKVVFFFVDNSLKIKFRFISETLDLALKTTNMNKIKIFKKSTAEQIETEISQWLATHALPTPNIVALDIKPITYPDGQLDFLAHIIYTS